MDVQVAKNMYDYGSIMKKQLLVSVALSIVTLLSTIFVVVFQAEAILILLGFVIIVVVFALLIFFIQMLSRLNRAKKISNDQSLINAFNLQIASIILTLVNAFITNQIMGLIFEIGNLALKYFIIKYIVEFVQNHSSELPSVPEFAFLDEGFRLFSISVFSQAVLSLITYFLPTGITLLLILLLVSLALTILSVVGQYKIAKGLVGIFQFAQYGRQTGYGQQFSTRAYQGSSGGFSSYVNQGQTTRPQDEDQRYQNPPPQYNSRANHHPMRTYQPQQFDENTEERNEKSLVECEICGANVPKGAKYCANCGAPLNNA